jgi:glycosyltransferase involved in cell wall biosynthesis
VKLIVQIPCFNEEDTLAETVADIPRHIDGIDSVEVLIIDDGSTDRTIEVARECGVDHVVVNTANQGLARTFSRGIDACLKQGADIIVNTDGDNQYAGKDIPKLVAPILDGEADLVIGDRSPHKSTEFSWLKRKLQYLGSWVVRRLSGAWVPDAVSGFRAFSREAALRLTVLSAFSYTIETVIQAGRKNMVIASVPIDTNPMTRESRLARSIPDFIQRSVVTMIRVYTMYKPLRVFLFVGSVLVLLGLIPIVRFIFYYASGGGGGHIQSLILGSLLVSSGFGVLVVGMIADLISFNRQLVEMTLERVKKIELEQLRLREKGKAD